jgi:gas vesicle protein
MNALDVVVQALELGAQLLGSASRRAQDFGETARDRAKDFGETATERAEDLGDSARERVRDFSKTARSRSKDFSKAARERVRDFGETASDIVDEIREQAPKKAKRIRKKFEEQFEPEPSVGSRVLSFMAGLSVGLGAALLLAPRSGRETRERLTRRARNIEFPKTAEMR